MLASPATQFWTPNVLGRHSPSEDQIRELLGLGAEERTESAGGKQRLAVGGPICEEAWMLPQPGQVLL